MSDGLFAALISRGSARAMTVKAVGVAIVLVSLGVTLACSCQAFGVKALWFGSVVGLAIFFAGYFGAVNAWRGGLVAASLLLGGGAQLWLTQPLWFPALSFDLASPVGLAMLSLLAAQAVLAIWVLWSGGALQRVARFLRAFGLFRTLIFLALGAFFSVSVLGYLPRGFVTSYMLHMMVGGAVISINLLSVSALASLPASFGPIRAAHPSVPAAVAFLASAALAWFAFEGLPHVEDEVVFLFHAKLIAAGSFWAPAPPEAARAGLEYYLLNVDQGRWFGVQTPGWPATLSLAVLFGAPWLLNPLLAGMSVLLAHGVARELTNKRRADVVAWLMCTSPWFLGTAASLMPHGAGLFFYFAVMAAAADPPAAGCHFACCGGFRRTLPGVAVCHSPA